MRRSFTHYLRLAAVLTGIGSATQTARPAAVKTLPDLKITLYVYNWAQVDSETLIRAKQEATRIYREIGVETLWIDHPLNEAQQNVAPVRVSEIRVNIVPQASKGLGVASNSLGIAPGTGPDRGRLYVCYDRVENLYRRQMATTMRRRTGRWATTVQILGYAIAHEVGHVLGVDAHSESGIMRAAWSPTDLLNLAYGDLAFTAQQAAVIRYEAELRQRADSAVMEHQRPK
jgi:hypothetical protein